MAKYATFNKRLTCKFGLLLMNCKQSEFGTNRNTIIGFLTGFYTTPTQTEQTFNVSLTVFPCDFRPFRA